MALFADYMQSLALRMREPEAATLTVPLALDAPYVYGPDLEGIVYAALVQVMREVPPADYQGFSYFALRDVSGSSASIYPGVNYIDIDQNPSRIISAQVDGRSTVFASPASFVQALTMTLGAATGAPRYTNRFTFFGGRCYYVGDTMELTYLIEPALDDWKSAPTPVLPIGYDIRVVDLAHKRVLISDYVPAWRP